MLRGSYTDPTKRQQSDRRDTEPAAKVAHVLGSSELLALPPHEHEVTVQVALFGAAGAGLRLNESLRLGS
jgi:hypothetical protein